MSDKKTVEINKEKLQKYFNKTIIRIGILFMVAIFLLNVGVNGWGVKLYVKCESVNGCLNPLYICEGNETEQCNIEYGNKYHEKLCDDGYCERIMQSGQEIGQKPNFLANNAGLMMFLLWVLMFGVNHIYYNKNKRSEPND